MVDNLFDAVVIGASAIGSRTAKLIADSGCNVLSIEEHRNIGSPLKCSGLVSHHIRELIPELPKEIILNEVKSAKFYSPNGNCLELTPKHPAYVIDRVEFDRFLFQNTEDKITTKIGERFEGFRCMEDCIKIKTNNEVYKSKILIGADGSDSVVRRQMKINPKYSILGLQTTVKGNFDPDSVELWFGSTIAPKFFAWVIPLDENFARVGLATNKNIMKFYKNFLEKRIGEMKRPVVVGKIPYGPLNRTSDDRVMLVGDAASQVKPFSGGGLIYGLIASGICADASIKALEENRFDKNFFKDNYDKKWKEKLALPIRKGLMIRKLFNHLPDNGLNVLFYLAGHRKRFLENWDMDLL